MLPNRRLRARPRLDPVTGVVVHPNDRLMHLSAELLNMIVGWLDDASVDRLMQTSKSLQQLVGPRAWEKVEVSCTDEAEAADLVWRLEVCMTGRQKRSLIERNFYAAQDVVDGNVIPHCARYVRRYIINGSDDDRLHNEKLCSHWLRFSLSNFRNVEVLETSCLDRPVADRIVTRRRLKALSLVNCYGLRKIPVVMSQMTGLEHLCFYNVECARFGQDDGETLRMLRGSATTLRSLELFHYHEKCSLAAEVKMDDIDFQLAALEFLIMCRFCLREAKAMLRVVDFPSLTELHIYQPAEELFKFFEALQTEFYGAEQPRLRSVELDLNHPGSIQMFNAQRSWLRSFTTLTSLRLDRWDSNMGNFSLLASAVAGHQGLRKLVFSHRDGQSGHARFGIPVLTTHVVGILARNLPELRWLEFAPDQDDLFETARELSALSQLEFLRCRHTKPEDYEFVLKMFTPILRGFLRQMQPGETWEGRYSLCLVQGETDQVKYDVASRLPEAWGGKRIIVDAETRRSVRIRKAAKIDPRLEEEDSDPVWVDKIGRDLKLID
ncbi:hypothetical protein PpBr36_02689 [Pyricularia pennisetigena]|uniref:hypothetical protein n=1 Tax=Pyricularia pennisetigena TaxID=1578925 RepID=UPI0011526510|nr:hypothetical protein PpBr36_02689 [Pyricularia pennisetigena]TLS31359.1 hypothetical protein PpBr36_02689 [Pyricularia pennisetigena]